MASLLRQRIATITQEEETIRTANGKLAEELDDMKCEVYKKERAPISKKRESEIRLARAT